jgi:multiple sugar transport system ATP-binding protein
VLLGKQRLAIDAAVLDERPFLAAYEGGPVVVGIRPEAISDRALVPDAPADHILHGTVELREALGPELFIHFTTPTVQLANTEAIADLPRDASRVAMNADAGAMLVGRFSAHSEAREGAAIDAVIDTDDLHFFDPGTGVAIYGDDERLSRAA